MTGRGREFPRNSEMEWEMGSLEFTTNACEHPSLTVS